MEVAMERTVGRTCRRKRSQQDSVSGCAKEEEDDSSSWQSVKPTVRLSLQSTGPSGARYLSEA